MLKVFTEIYEHCIVKGGYGFTIPYIYNIHNTNYPLKTIAEIIEVFIDAPDKYIITYCSDLEEFILGLPKPQEQGPLKYYSRFGNLYYDEEKLGSFNTFQDLTKFIVNKYNPIIQGEKYSKNMETLKWE